MSNHSFTLSSSKRKGLHDETHNSTTHVMGKESSYDQTNTSVNKYGNLTHQQVHDSSMKAGKDAAGVVSGTLDGLKAKYGNDMNVATDMSMAAAYATNKVATIAALQDGENIGKWSDQDQKTFGEFQGDNKSQVQMNALGKLADKSFGHKLSAAAAGAVADASIAQGTQMAALHEGIKKVGESNYINNAVTASQAQQHALDRGIDEVGAKRYINNAGESAAGASRSQDSEIRAHHGNYVKDQGTLGTQKGADAHATAQIHQSHGVGGQEALAHYNANKNVEGNYKEMKVNRDKQAQLRKELKSLESQRDGIEGDEKALESAKEDLAGISGERAQLNKEYRESFKNGKNHMSTQEFKRRADAISQKEAGAKATISALSGKYQQGTAAAERDMDQRISQIKSELGDYDISNIGTAQGLNNMETLGGVADVTHNGGVGEAADNRFYEGGRRMAETTTQASTMRNTGTTSHQAGSYSGTVRGTQTISEMKAKEATARNFLSQIDPAMVSSVASQMGPAIASNPVALAAAVEAADTTRSFTADGSTTRASFNLATGEVGNSFRDFSNTYDAFSHNRANIADSIGMVGTDQLSTGSANIMGRHAAIETGRLVGEVAKRAATRNLKGGAGGGDVADAAPAQTPREELEGLFKKTPGRGAE